MPIRRRTRDERWYVCKDDDALDDAPAKDLNSYQRTYDYDHLAEYVDALAPHERPTRFRARPLSAMWQTRVSSMTDADVWSIFATHVTAIERLLDERGEEIEVRYEGEIDKRRIVDAHRDNGDIPYAVYTEIATAILHHGITADRTPFGSPDTWRQWLLERTLVSRARRDDTAARALGRVSARTPTTS